MNHNRNRGLLVIGVFKLFKGVSLLVLAFGIHHFLHRDLQESLERWINSFRFDPHNRYIAALLAKAGLVDDRKLEELSLLTLVYSTLFLTEGVGLLLEKHWAEWLSVIATASFLPLEAYEIMRHFTALRVALFVGNLAIVWFLVVTLRRDSNEQPGGKR